MNKIVKMGMACMLAATTLVGCGSSAPEEDKNVITIGISPDYAPYESLTKEGDIVGFDPDMVAWFEDYLTEETGEEYDLQFKQMSFDNIITQIQGDQIQVGISGFSYDEEKEAEWSNAYIKTAQVAVVAKGSSLKSTSELSGKKLAAQTGSTGENAAQTVAGAEVSSVQNVQDIFTGLAANQYDAAVVDLGVAKQYVENGSFELLEGTLLDEQNYIIAKKGNTEMIDLMNQCIEAFIASDEYAVLCDQYDLLPLE